MKKTTQLISTGIILALLGSNIIISSQYISDSKEFQTEIKHKNEIIRSKQTEIQTKQQEFTNILKKNQDKIQVLTDEVNKTKNDLNQTQQENDSLTNQLKQLKDRKEVNAHHQTYYDVTAYTSGKESTGKSSSDPAYRITASGTKVQEGRTVACPQSIPFGTKINIQNVGLRVCEDHGSAITNNKLDLYVESLNKAMEFGRKKLLVEILS